MKKHILLFFVISVFLLNACQDSPKEKLPTPTASSTPVPFHTNTPIPTPTFTLTPTPTNTLTPKQQALELVAASGNLYISDHKNVRSPLNINEFADFSGFSFSPDGSEIVFSACSLEDVSTSDCHQNLYILDRENGKIEALIKDNSRWYLIPAWSPDGQWIAFGECERGIIHPDGTGLHNFGCFVGDALTIVWSPDSQSIAYVTQG